MSADDRDVEARLRRAIESRTTSVEPGPDGHNRIEDKLMDAQRTTARQRGWLIGVTAAAAAAAVVVAVVVAQDDDDEQIGTATSTVSSTVTSSVPSSTTTVPAPVVDRSVPLWPAVDSAQRFDDPVAAARSFAVDLVGFTDPVVGQFRQGDTRSGEVPVRAKANGSETTVLVRQLEDDAWWVIGAVCEGITIDEPEPGATLPKDRFDVRGTALAFEGHVNVSLFEDGNPEAIGEGFVTGSGSPPAGPYEATIDYATPTQDFGVLVLWEPSGEDGSVWQATAIRVRFP